MIENIEYDKNAVLLEKEDGIAHIRLNRPATMNSVNKDICFGLGARLNELSADDGIKAVVLSGEGRSFCAGGDLPTIEAICASKPDEIYNRLRLDFNAIVLLYNFNKPLVAAVHGKIMGGGCGFAAACDFVCADETTSFGFPFLDLGILPDMGVLFLVTQKIGLPLSRKALLLGEPLLAKEAEKIGFVDYLVPKDEHIDQAFTIAKKMAGKFPAAVQFAKKHLNQVNALSFSQSLEREIQQQSLLWCTPQVKQTMEKIIQKFSNKKE